MIPTRSFREPFCIRCLSHGVRSAAQLDQEAAAALELTAEDVRILRDGDEHGAPHWKAYNKTHRIGVCSRCTTAGETAAQLTAAIAAYIKDARNTFAESMLDAKEK